MLRQDCLRSYRETDLRSLKTGTTKSNKRNLVFFGKITPSSEKIRRHFKSVAIAVNFVILFSRSFVFIANLWLNFVITE